MYSNTSASWDFYLYARNSVGNFFSNESFWLSVDFAHWLQFREKAKNYNQGSSRLDQSDRLPIKEFSSCCGNMGMCDVLEENYVLEACRSNLSSKILFYFTYVFFVNARIYRFTIVQIFDEALVARIHKSQLFDVHAMNRVEFLDCHLVQSINQSYSMISVYNKSITQLDLFPSIVTMEVKIYRNYFYHIILDLYTTASWLSPVHYRPSMLSWTLNIVMTDMLGSLCWLLWRPGSWITVLEEDWSRAVQDLYHNRPSCLLFVTDGFHLLAASFEGFALWWLGKRKLKTSLFSSFNSSIFF